LKQPKVATAAPARVTQQPSRVASPSSASGSNRYLLIAVAAVCLIALAMRRRPRQLPGQSDSSPPAVAGITEERPTAEVIPLHRAS